MPSSSGKTDPPPTPTNSISQPSTSTSSQPLSPVASPPFSTPRGKKRSRTEGEGENVIAQLERTETREMPVVAGSFNSKIGIIGGSGLNNPTLFEATSESPEDTQYGSPSDTLREGLIGGVPCILLARHGRKHTIMPTNVNYRANLWALKARGCTHVLVSTACGSLQENIHPGDFVILDQFIDRTTKRSQTFHDGQEGHPPGILHLPMDTPFCPDTSACLRESCETLGYNFHPTGTVVTVEGPRFSSKAESRMFRQWGADVINMTTVPEVVLARELGLCYAAIAMATDYDCWREGQEAVTVEAVMATFRSNAEKAINVLKMAVNKIAAEDWSKRISALQTSVNSNLMKSA